MSTDSSPSLPFVPDGQAEDVARPVLRVGWLAKGFLFVVIGLLSIELARRGLTARDADQKGALETLADAPVGRVAVFAVSAGLMLYAAWQLWSAIVQDGEDEDGTDAVIHLFTRIGWVGLAGVYGLLAWTGLRMAVSGAHSSSNASSGSSGSSDEQSPTSPTGLTARLLDIPTGRVIVVVIGVVTIGVGLYQLRKGLRRDFLDDIDTSGLGPVQRPVLVSLGVAGFAARSLLMGTAGWLFVSAAFANDADRAAGIDQSLQTLTEVTGGQLLLAATGLGLLAAGAYDMATFRRQRITE